jgi:hypothetical protein
LSSLGADGSISSFRQREPWIKNTTNMKAD